MSNRLGEQIHVLRTPMELQYKETVRHARITGVQHFDSKECSYCLEFHSDDMQPRHEWVRPEELMDDEALANYQKAKEQERLDAEQKAKDEQEKRDAHAQAQEKDTSADEPPGEEETGAEG